MALAIRRMLAQEASDVAAATRECPEAAQWSEASYASLAADADGPGAVLVALQGRRIVGFLAMRVVSDEMEILNLGVAAGSRRKGVATRLMNAAFAAAQASGARAAFCEVRESNLTAQAFYGKHGFQRRGRRVRYYRDPEEDAVVMMKGELSGPGPAGP